MSIEKDFMDYVFVGGEKVEFSAEGVATFLEENRLVQMLGNIGNIARYNGTTDKPWTVLMHSLLCLELAKELSITKRPALLKSVLFHDLSEAFVGDIPRPIKSLCGKGYKDFERAVEENIARKFDLAYNSKHVDVKYFDDLAAKFEMLYFFGEDPFTTMDPKLDLDRVFENINMLQDLPKSELMGIFLDELALLEVEC